MVSNVFVLDQAAQMHNIYLKSIYPQVLRKPMNPLKTRDFTPFSKYQVFRSKYLVFQIHGVKNHGFLPSKSLEKPSKIQGFRSKYQVFRKYVTIVSHKYHQSLKSNIRITKTEIMKVYIFLNWDFLHARLNSHCKAQSYTKKKYKKIKAYRKSVYKEPTVNRR